MADPAPDTAEWVARAREGDEAAARALVERLHPLVLKIVRSHRPVRTDEEDLAQIVFSRVFAHLDQYTGTVPIEHWVSRIAVNACINQLRAEQCRPELRFADLGEDEAVILEAVTAAREPDPAHQVAARDLAAKLLETLKPEDRLVISMLDLEERSLAEIRQLTGWNLSLIKVRAFRARRRLRKQLQRLSRLPAP
jgi:RNA polymerase sigma-70 factor (ECF subfamily)